MRALIHYEMYMPSQLISDEPHFKFSLDEVTLDVVALLLSECKLKLYRYRSLWVCECIGKMAGTDIKLECRSDTSANALTGLVKRYIELRTMFEASA